MAEEDRLLRQNKFNRFAWSCATTCCSGLIFALLASGIVSLRWNADAVLIGLGLLFLAASFVSLAERWRSIFGVTAVVFFFFALAETGTLLFKNLQMYWGGLKTEYLVQKDGRPPRNRIHYVSLGGPLGFGTDPLMKVSAKKILEGKLIYDVTYSFDRQGYRKTGGRAEGGCSFLFFADSFSFGDGLNDNETLPEQFSKRLNYRYQVANLGISGYGPHQMLRSLELDLPSSVVERPISAVFYIWLSEHAFRVMGSTPWNRFGPKYLLTEEEQPVYAGKLNGLGGASLAGWSFTENMINMMRSSKLFTLTYKFPETRDPEFQARSIKRLTAIVATARDIVLKKYGAQFLVILWPDESELSKNTIESFARSKIPVANNGDFLPNWTNDYLINGDGHPSALANQRMGKALAAKFGKCRGQFP